MASEIKIFCCYAHKDERLLNKLKIQLRPLQREGLIDIWHDLDIYAGTEWEREINEHLNTAKIILLLVSPDFIDSEYCYGSEMKQAIQRHEQGEAHVIPIILRPVYWQGSPFGKLQALPKDAKPVMSTSWHSQDEAFFNVAEGIRRAVKLLQTNENHIQHNAKQPQQPLQEQFSRKSKEQWIEQGTTHHNAKRYEEALEAYEQAICLDPNDASLHIKKGQVLSSLSHYSEALNAYKQAISLSTYLKSTDMFELAILLEQMGRLEDAERIRVRADDIHDWEFWFPKG